MESEGSLACSQEPATYPYLESDESNLLRLILFPYRHTKSIPVHVVPNKLLTYSGLILIKVHYVKDASQKHGKRNCSPLFTATASGLSPERNMLWCTKLNKYTSLLNRAEWSQLLCKYSMLLLQSECCSTMCVCCMNNIYFWLEDEANIFKETRLVFER